VIPRQFIRMPGAVRGAHSTLDGPAHRLRFRCSMVLLIQAFGGGNGSGFVSSFTMISRTGRRASEQASAHRQIAGALSRSGCGFLRRKVRARSCPAIWEAEGERANGVRFNDCYLLPEPSAWVCVVGRLPNWGATRPMTRILVVDDDEEVGRLLEHVLIGARYHVDRTYAVAGGARIWTAIPMTL
jgi:hypothetical protein